MFKKIITPPKKKRIEMKDKFSVLVISCAYLWNDCGPVCFLTSSWSSYSSSLPLFSVTFWFDRLLFLHVTKGTQSTEINVAIFLSQLSLTSCHRVKYIGLCCQTSLSQPWFNQLSGMQSSQTLLTWNTGECKLGFWSPRTSSFLFFPICISECKMLIKWNKIYSFNAL